MPVTNSKHFCIGLLPRTSLALVLALAGACDAGGFGASDGDGSTGASSTSEDGGTGSDASSSSGSDEPTTDAGGSGGEDEGDVLDLPATPFNYANPDLPAHFRTPLVRDLDNTPVDNPITDHGATLGRVLFYDTALSRNETVACGSCHRQAAGFSDTSQLSEGFAGGLTGRNSMGLSESRWYATGRFFWDERAATLEEQVLGPIQNEVEMGLTLTELVERVAARPYYRDLFIAAFGDEEVTTDRIARALAQFVRAMASYRSRFDEGLAAAGSIRSEFANFTAAENLGKDLFLQPRTACVACHLGGPPPPPGQDFRNQAIFLPLEPLNNGLDAGPVEDDNGVGDITGDPADDGRFKSSSLRNIAVSGPYMHDGRFATLAEVIDHYDSGVKPHPNLDPRLRGPDQQPRRMNLTPAEKSALVAFLGTLTDEALLTDPKFGDPFVR
ncbi:cytochrome-c peroxidase [Nannocystis punicea]|uniref:Cytochrome-c peroxidase n=1 Tax=Nannocystis punicea TaxID=2995304 RepID=A0ABY7GYW5_9BACT|nr:cytochrome c peroxidase [Nannocystis poenicansa]WAS91989.1 cytochrome-c peroxidase [Nannocystis poenicansa]